MGAIAGGVGGHAVGNKFGNHGIIGTLAGAFLGSKAEDELKNRHKQSQQQQQQQQYGGGSQYGGSSGSGHHHKHHHNSGY